MTARNLRLGLGLALILWCASVFPGGKTRVRVSLTSSVVVGLGSLGLAVAIEMSPMVGPATTTLTDVLAKFRWVGEQLSSAAYDGKELLDVAWTQELVPRLQAKGLDVAKIRDKNQLIPLHCAIVNAIVAEDLAFIQQDKQGMAMRSREMVDEAEGRLTANLSWYDDNDSKTAGEGETHIIRRGRLLR